MSLGDKLINLRKKYNMTQEEVADKIDVTRQTISNWELNQTKPDIDQLKGLSKLYKVSVDELIDNDVKDIIVEKVSNVEKLAGLLYNILKGIIIFLLGMFILSILSIILFSGIRSSYMVSVDESTTFRCALDNQAYTITITRRGSEPIEITGAGELYALLNLGNYENTNEIIFRVIEHIEENGGRCA